MLKLIPSSLLAALVFAAGPGAAIGAEILITQQMALDGTVPGTDSPGFPITISQSGTYKLDSNLSVETTTSANGIVVTAHDVTIDFNGFRLHGNAAGNHGITSTMNSLTIKNGTIAVFKGSGISGRGPFWEIDNMRIVFNRQNGIVATVGSGPVPAARQWVISNSEISENDLIGIRISGVVGAMLIRNNVINGNKREGISATHAHIEGNLISGNGTAVTSPGVYVIKGMVLGNTITNNSGYGLQGGLSSVGYGNNTFTDNEEGSVLIGTAVHPNLCEYDPC